MTLPNYEKDRQQQSWVETPGGKAARIIANEDGSPLTGGLHTDSIAYADTSFVVGDSPATHDVATDLGYDGESLMVANTHATASILVDWTHDGTNYKTQITLPAGATLSKAFKFKKVRITHSGSDSSYFVIAS